MAQNTGMVALPETVSSEIIENVSGENGQSWVMKYGTKMTLTAGGDTFNVITSTPVADWVEEGGQKPVSGFGTATRKVKPAKLATIIPMTSEFVADAPGLFEFMKTNAPAALAAKFDATVLAGQAAGSVPANNFDTIGHRGTQFVIGAKVDGTKQLGDSLLEAMNYLAVNGGGYSNSIIGTQRLMIAALTSKDSNGRKHFDGLNMASPELLFTKTNVVENLVPRDYHINYTEGTDMFDVDMSAESGYWTPVGLLGPIHLINWGILGQISYKIWEGPLYGPGNTIIHRGAQDNMVNLTIEGRFGCLVKLPMSLDAMNNFVQIVVPGHAPVTP